MKRELGSSTDSDISTLTPHAEYTKYLYSNGFLTAEGVNVLIASSIKNYAKIKSPSLIDCSFDRDGSKKIIFNLRPTAIKNVERTLCGFLDNYKKLHLQNIQDDKEINIILPLCFNFNNENELSQEKGNHFALMYFNGNKRDGIKSATYINPCNKRNEIDSNYFDIGCMIEHLSKARKDIKLESIENISCEQQKDQNSILGGLITATNAFRIAIGLYPTPNFSVESSQNSACKVFCSLDPENVERYQLWSGITRPDPPGEKQKSSDFQLWSSQVKYDPPGKKNYHDYTRPSPQHETNSTGIHVQSLLRKMFSLCLSK